jgi:hypothetical protein
MDWIWPMGHNFLKKMELQSFFLQKNCGPGMENDLFKTQFTFAREKTKSPWGRVMCSEGSSLAGKEGLTG